MVRSQGRAVRLDAWVLSRLSPAMGPGRDVGSEYLSELADAPPGRRIPVADGSLACNCSRALSGLFLAAACVLAAAAVLVHDVPIAPIRVPVVAVLSALCAATGAGALMHLLVNAVRFRAAPGDDWGATITDSDALWAAFAILIGVGQYLMYR